MKWLKETVPFALVILCVLGMFSGCVFGETTDGLTSEASSVEDSLPELDKDALENWGVFDSIPSLYTRIDRNLENPNYVVVTLKNVVVMRGGDRAVRNSMTDNIWVINRKSLLNSDRLQFYDNEKIKVLMKDDSTNRALHGDEITVTGVLDTKNLMIFDAEYKMIKPAD